MGQPSGRVDRPGAETGAMLAERSPERLPPTGKERAKRPAMPIRAAFAAVVRRLPGTRTELDNSSMMFLILCFPVV